MQNDFCNTIDPNRTSFHSVHTLDAWAAARPSGLKARGRSDRDGQRALDRAIPVVFAVGFFDGKVVDGSITLLHQPCGVIVPVLVPVGTEPVAAVVMPLVSEAYGNTIFGECPELIDQTVIQFACPLSLQEGDDRRTSNHKLASITAATIMGVAQRDLFGVASVPTVLGHPNLLDSGVEREGRKWGA